MKYPARIKKELPQHLRRERDGDCPQHRAWIRQQHCLFENERCAGRMQAHHVRGSWNAGTAFKPHDSWCVPLCAFHHDEGHRQGWYGTIESMKRAAELLAKRSPALRKMKEG